MQVLVTEEPSFRLTGERGLLVLVMVLVVLLVVMWGRGRSVCPSFFCCFLRVLVVVVVVVMVVVVVAGLMTRALRTIALSSSTFLPTVGIL